MARKLTKENSFVSDTKQFVENGTTWDANQIETKADVRLDEDTGTGEAAIIRMFEFAVNPEAFKQHTPTKQELFNSHSQGIESFLWKDGLTVIPEVAPRVTLNKKKNKYRIFVGARPQRGHLLHEQPKTLLQHANPHKL